MHNGTSRPAPLNALRAFEAAARHLSFKKAALEMHLTPGAVSHQVKVLEEHLGVTLFRRLTRALELTADARAMLPRVREGLESLGAALQSVRAREEACVLTVVTPPNFATRWLVPRLARFTGEHPRVELHLASRAAMIDGRDGPAAEASEDSTRVQVRFGNGRYAGAHVDELFRAVYVAVCSPKLASGPHALREPADLRHHTLLHEDTVTEESARPSWGDWLASASVPEVDATRGPHFSDASLAVEAAIEGLGVALVMKPLVGAEIDARRLVIPFGHSTLASFAYYLVTPEADRERRAPAAFRAWILEESASER